MKKAKILIGVVLFLFSPFWGYIAYNLTNQSDLTAGVAGLTMICVGISLVIDATFSEKQ